MTGLNRVSSDSPIPSRYSKRFPRFEPAKGSLIQYIRTLLEEQRRSWKQLAEGYASLQKVRTREVECDGYAVTLQFNPGRMASTSAKVDAESLRARRCFLCLENLPEEQRGILYGTEFLMLCNPAPIVPHHYTVSHVQHRPQELKGVFRTLLALANEVSPDLTLFYNGPKCGASAPDHLHFQACPGGAIPVERESSSTPRRVKWGSLGNVDFFRLKGLDREAFVLEGTEEAGIEQAMLRLLEAMNLVFGGHEEPMMNVLCSFADRKWRVIVFPRVKHRPAAYFFEDERRIVVSPAAIDMGGLMIVPREQDFLRLDGLTIREIFKEVTISPSVVDQILARL